MFGHDESQKHQIEKHLKKYGRITTIECFKKYNITRLSQYIMMLRRSDWDIESMPVKQKNKKPYVIYQLKKTPATN